MLPAPSIVATLGSRLAKETGKSFEIFLRLGQIARLADVPAIAYNLFRCSVMSCLFFTIHMRISVFPILLPTCPR